MLTLGIPNYNRKDAVCTNIKEMLENEIHKKINILIIDDASPDGAYEALLEICAGTSIKVYKNDSNLGYAGNCLRLIEEFETEYIIINSNEDPLISKNIDALKKFLISHKPVFVSTQFFLNRQGKQMLYRGKPTIGLIEPEELHNGCFYISGLVYRKSEVLASINRIKDYLLKPGGAIYPQTLISADLLLNYPKLCFWWDQPIARKAFQYESEIVDKASGKYYHMPARWDQFKFYVDFYQSRVDQAPNIEYKKNAKVMLDNQCKNFIKTIRHAIKTERPDLLEGFDAGAKEFYCNSLLKRVFRLLKRLIKEPVTTIKIIFKKFISRIGN